MKDGGAAGVTAAPAAVAAGGLHRGREGCARTECLCQDTDPGTELMPTLGVQISS